MTAPIRQPDVPLDYGSKPPPPQSTGKDEWAYVAPMLVFLLFTFVGGNWPELYPLTYVAKTAIVAGLLAWYWRYYTRIRWNHWWLGAVLGVVGVVQWVGMQLWLQNNFAFFAPPAAEDLFNPFARIEPGWMAWAFVGVRLVGAVLLVPVMEELFWRDWLWRRFVAPNDFKLAEVGEWDWTAFLLVSVFFATVHGNWWLTSIVWGLMVGGLLVYTKSLGACIVMHAVTNALLAAYVLRTGDWAFW